MSDQSHTLSAPADVFRVLAAHPRRWIIPIVTVTALATIYAAARPKRWEATQALIVRNEATTSEARPGEFRHTEQMKALQETILQVVKSRSVLEAALADVGPAADGAPQAQWPTADDVLSLRKAMKLTPPDGAEFGSTEVFYLKVQDEDRQRAVALASAICDQLRARLQQLRDSKAQSMINELENAAVLAEADLQETTVRLSALEAHVGGDLAELRILNEASSGEGDLRRKTIEIENELRQAREALHGDEQLLQLLKDARVDPGRLLATSDRLLQTQPALRQLKEGLISAQLLTAGLRGRMTDKHPLVLAAIDGEQEVSEQLHQELDIAVRSAEANRRLNSDRVRTLEAQVADSQRRLQTLADLRAEYSNLIAESTHRTQSLEEARRNLSDARASQAGAQGASVVAVIDTPDVGNGPIGPSRASIVLMGLFGGVVFGLGSAFLTIPVASPAPALLTTLDEQPRQTNGRHVAVSQPEVAVSLSLKDALRRQIH